jgi:hypothetical protein
MDALAVRSEAGSGSVADNERRDQTKNTLKSEGNPLFVFAHLPHLDGGNQRSTFSVQWSTSVLSVAVQVALTIADLTQSSPIVVAFRVRVQMAHPFVDGIHCFF